MAFDLKKHVIRVQGGREYLPVSARLIWFRGEHPDWGIVTEAIEINLEKQYAIYKASIFNEEGKLMATATKMENVKGFGDYLEKAECVPLTTRILTAEGWKTHDELRLGELVSAYNAETDQLEWVPLLAVRRYHDAPVVRAHNAKGFDVVCTPDHKWPVRYSVTSGGKRYEYRKLRETQALTTADAMVVAAPAPSGSMAVTPQQAFVMGLLITDGSLRYNGKHIHGYICQSKPHNVALFRERLQGIACREEEIPAHTRTFPTGKTHDCLVGYRWEVPARYLHELHEAFGIEHETELPLVVSGLSADARAALLEAMTLAESDARGSFAQMPGRNDWVIDLWTALCALEGSMVCKSTVRTSVGGIWVARRKKTRQVWASNIVVEPRGTLDVWCPQTPLGTWVARFDNDVVTITGNTGAVGRALAYCGYGTQFAPELEEGNRLADAPRGGGGGMNRFGSGPRSGGGGNGYNGDGGGSAGGGGYNGANNGGGGNGFGNRPGGSAPPPLMNRAPAPVVRDLPPPPASDGPDDDFGDDHAPAPPPRAAATRPAPTNRDASAAAPPSGGITRVREPERPTLDPGGDDDDDENPFDDEDDLDNVSAPPPASARPAASPRPAAAPARPTPAEDNDNDEADAAPAAPKPNPLGGNRCSVAGCSNVLTTGQMSMSMNKFGKAVCLLHQRDMAPLAAAGTGAAAPRRGAAPKSGADDGLL